MRKYVRRIVMWIVGAAFALALAIILTVLIRLGMRTGLVFLHDAIPVAFHSVYRDPILIVAFVVAAILLWIAPWEEFGKEEEETNVIRGREVTSFQQAHKRVESKLRAQRAQLRSRRPSSRGRSDS